MEKEAEEIFRELKDDISAYAKLKVELIKLNAYERVGKIFAVLSYGLLLSALIFFAFLFAMLALGFLLSKQLDSTTAGFAIVAGLYVIFILLVIFNRKRIRLRVMNIIISALNANEQKKEAAAIATAEDAAAKATAEDTETKATIEDAET
ncbi:MAG: phage holin family protein [Tannerella sp.]|jgi:glucan phosphoethanolaminetransferase (alkaline phosphatase superfamily)|nr:phage holin family protein [Tannerella sp.]